MKLFVDSLSDAATEQIAVMSTAFVLLNTLCWLLGFGGIIQRLALHAANSLKATIGRFQKHAHNPVDRVFSGRATFLAGSLQIVCRLF